MSPASAVGRRAFADARTRTISFGLLFFSVGYINPTGYKSTYPTAHDRLQFAHDLGSNKAIRLFYGAPHDLVSIGGYSAWRVGGTMTIFAGIWALLGATRALRAEEDSGRQEILLSGVIGRGSAYIGAMGAIAAGALLLWGAMFLGLLAGGLPVSGAAYLALVIVSPIPVFAGVGAVASQLAPVKRLASELALGALMLAFAARVVADTAGSWDWLGWATPLGWAEHARAFADPRPAVLLLSVSTGAALIALAGLVSVRRDVGSGLLGRADTAEPRPLLLGSPLRLAVRGERGSFLAWLAGAGSFALIIGVMSSAFASVHLSENVRQQLARVGGASILTASGALSFYFVFFALAVSLFACSQISAIRSDEAEGRVETMLVLPFGRRRWLAERLALAAASAGFLALAIGLLTWAGAATQHVGVGLWGMLEAGANCIPALLLFSGLGGLAFAVVPRMSAGIAYSLVSVTFVWELFGAILGAPEWTLGISPFHHIGLVPAQPFKLVGAVVMVGVAALTATAAVAIFGRRDLQNA